MNTPQLVVLWYAGLLIALITTAKSLDSYGGESWLIASVIILAALFIYTFRPHPKSNKRVVAAWVVMPFILIALSLGGYLVWEYYQKEEKLNELRTEAIRKARTLVNKEGMPLADSQKFKRLLEIDTKKAVNLVDQLEREEKGGSIADLLEKRKQERKQLIKEYENFKKENRK